MSEQPQESMAEATFVVNVSNAEVEAQMQHARESISKERENMERSRQQFIQEKGHAPGQGPLDKTGTMDDLPVLGPDGEVLESVDEAKKINERLYELGVEQRPDPNEIPPERVQ